MARAGPDDGDLLAAVLAERFPRPSQMRREAARQRPAATLPDDDEVTIARRRKILNDGMRPLSRFAVTHRVA